jgi:hypothetical protein
MYRPGEEPTEENIQAHRQNLIAARLQNFEAVQACQLEEVRCARLTAKGIRHKSKLHKLQKQYEQSLHWLHELGQHPLTSTVEYEDRQKVLTQKEMNDATES